MVMSLDRASKWAEIIGAITVVLGIIFVGLEIRQNTRAQMFYTTQSLVGDYNASLRSMADASDECFFMRGYASFDQLDPAESLKFSLFILPALRIWEQMYYSSLEHGMDLEVFAGFEGQMRTNLAIPGITEYFQLRRQYFGARFQTYVDGVIAETDPTKNLYGFEDFEGCEL